MGKVCFVKPWPPSYFSGDMATFDAETEKRLIDAGVAEAVVAEPAETLLVEQVLPKEPVVEVKPAVKNKR